MSSINIENLSVNFRLYHDRTPSLKNWFTSLFNRTNQLTHEDFYAINNINLEVKSGERIGIVGHNGAGKSTLLKAICRIYEPSRGRVIIDGSVAPLLEIGAGFHHEFSGRENIYLNGSILGYSLQELKNMESDIIEFAEIEKFIDMPVKYYSTGMYMRLAFAIATAVHPDILIIDEVFAGGDVSFINKAKARMFEMMDKANIMLMVSHDHELIRQLCNRVILLNKGVIVADGEPNYVIDRYLAGV